MKRMRFFRTICGFCGICLTLTTFIPLATFAFEPAGIAQQVELPEPAREESEYTKNYPSDAYYLDDGNSDSIIVANKPLYDTYSITERKLRNLPTALSNKDYYYGEKTVYLTFDDGPDPDNTPRILSILREAGIKATFFVVGNQVELYPDVLRQIYLDGHAIGNHTYNHNYRQLYQTVETYTQQLHKTDDIIKNILGVRPRISRAPGGSAGSFTKEYWKTLHNEGYIEVGWNVSSGDASSSKAHQLVNNIASQMNKKFLWSHSIVLMHDGRGHNETVMALPEIIKLYKEQGFEFRVVNTQTPPAW